MAFYNRHILHGKLNDESLNKYRNLDYNENSLDNRLNYINNLLNSKFDDEGRNFFEIYFDEKYKCELSQGEELSEKNNVCQTLEKMTNYLLGSTEMRKLRNEERQKYFFYVDRDEFKKRTCKESSLNKMIDSQNKNNSNQDNAIHFLLNTNHNYKKSKGQVITKEDLKENTKTGEVLRDYNKYLEFVTNEIKNPTKYKGMRNKLTKIKNGVSQDMLLSKTMLNGTFGERLRNQITETTPCVDWDEFSWCDSNQVKELLLLSSREFDFGSDLYHLLLDFKIIINEMFNMKLFTNQEIKVIKLIIKGYNQTEISEVLNVTRQRVNFIIKKISKDICDYSTKR